MSSQGSSSRRPLHLQPPTGINILPPSPIDPSHSSPFRSPSPSTQRPPFAADALSASPSDDAGLLLPTRIEDTGVPLARVPSPSSPDYRPRPKHHRRTSSSHQVRETVDGSQSMTEDGRLVNQYRIGKSLGQGAYAKVELGVDVTTGKEYAIKEFSKSRLSYHALQERQRQSARSRLRKANRRKEMTGAIDKSDTPVSGGPWAVTEEREDDPLGLIRREIAVMKKLDHPNLIHLYEAISVPDADALFLVLEYLPGGTLMEVQVGGDTSQLKPPFPREQTREYFRQLCLGLEYLHHNEVVHRDIKPDNILLSADREIVKLCDFGVSEMFQGDDRIRHTGGSPAFLSPESFQTNTSEVHGKAVDIWALGVTLYCMLTGKLPFNVENPIDLFEAVKSQEPTIPADWSEDQTDLVKRMLIKDPAERIRMREIRSHSWVTQSGTEAMITKDDNLYYVGQQVEEPTPEELGLAIRPRRGIFTLIRAVQKMRRLGHLRRTLSGRTSSSSIPGSMDSYLSTSDDTNPTELDEKGIASPEDIGTDEEGQDTPGVRATLRESLRRLRVETDLHHHTSTSHAHTHHPESTHRHVHHIHHLKHHLRRSGDVIRGRDSAGEEQTQARTLVDSPGSTGSEAEGSDLRAATAGLRLTDSPTVDEPQLMDEPEGPEESERVSSPGQMESPGEMDSQEMFDSPTDSPGVVDEPGLVASPTSDSPKQMNSPGLVDSPVSSSSLPPPKITDSPLSDDPDTAELTNEPVMIMESPTSL